MIHKEFWRDLTYFLINRNNFIRHASTGEKRQTPLGWLTTVGDFWSVSANIRQDRRQELLNGTSKTLRGTHSGTYRFPGTAYNQTLGVHTHRQVSWLGRR